jgi:hypothetical protein
LTNIKNKTPGTAGRFIINSALCGCETMFHQSKLPLPLV